MIVNSFFEYGFRINLPKQSGKKQEGPLGLMQNNYDEQADLFMCEEEENPYIDSVHHFWDYIKNHCTELDTVKFINFHPTSSDLPSNTLGIRWILIALYYLQDLEAVFIHILSDREFLMMYCL